MERSPLSLLICLMAVVSGTLQSPDAAWAMPNGQSPSDIGVDTAGLLTQNSASSRPEPSTVFPTEQTDGRSTAQAGEVPCLHALWETEGAGPSVEEGECGAATQSSPAFSFHLGRRLGAPRGIHGKLDGILVDYRLTGGIRLKGIAGYPARSGSDGLDLGRQVFGLSAEAPKIARRWGLNSYLIEQQAGGRLTDRAVGGSLSYRRPERSLVLSLDYDLPESTLGAFTAAGAWKLPADINLGATVDVRTAPIAQRQKRYLQQSTAAMEGWEWTLPTDRIRHHTKDGSKEVTTLSLMLSHRVSPSLQLAGDVAYLDVSAEHDGNETGAGVDKPSREYFYHFKLSGKDLMLSGDRSMLDFRHSVTESFRVSTASIDSKYAINRAWKISPGFRADYRDNVLENSIQWKTAPSLRMEYQWRKGYRFQVEAGGEWKKEEDGDDDIRSASYFAHFQYQATF